MDAEWTDGWIKDARTLLYAEYDRKYARHPIPDEEDGKEGTGGNDGAAATVQEVSTRLIMVLPLLQPMLPQHVNQFDNLPIFKHKKPALSQNELDRYLAAPTEACKNALKWWWDRWAEYPRLSRMALGYLAIPGTSCVLMFVVTTFNVLE